MHCTPLQRHCDIIVKHAKLLFCGNKQMPEFCNGPRSTNVYLVLNRLYKAAPTACSTFECVEGGGQPAMTSQINANTP